MAPAFHLDNMRRNLRIRLTTILRLLASVTAAVLILPIAISLFHPWTRLCCEVQEINITTGQARLSRYFWFMKLSERVEETPLSHALGGETVNAADIEPWHRVNTFSPGIPNSPHHRFHGALSQAEATGNITSPPLTTPERRRIVARHILTLWQHAGNDNGREVMTYLAEELDRVIEAAK